MTEKQKNGEAGGANPRDETLTALLRAWKGIEPDAGFEAGVWRRIRAWQIPETQDFAPGTVIREGTFWWPFGAAAAAVAAAVLIGGLLAFLITEPDRRQHVSPALSHPRTLAGSYLSMAAGETP